MYSFGVKSWPARWLLLCTLVTLLNACAAPDTLEPQLPAEITPQASLPSGFEDALVANVSRPTALAFMPDGRLLITTQTGQLRIFQDSLSTALDLSGRLCTNSERGLLGVAVDPNAASNGFIYLYYTYDKHGSCARNATSSPVNRVSRFTLSGGSVSPSSERVLIDNIPSPNGNHNGGDLHFGHDGMLYVSVGDGGCDYRGDSGCAGQNNAARDRHTLLGKVLRVTPNGEIPESNPFTGAGSVRCHTGNAAPGKVCQETYAWGLRNPFRMAFDPNARGTRFFINDVGQNTREEVDLGAAGADYGWNMREGKCRNGGGDCGGAPSGLTNPVFDYARSSSGSFAGCKSITGGAVVPNGVWPGFDGAYLFSDYVCGKIFKLVGTGSGYSASVFVSGLGSSSAVHLTFGPYGDSRALFYTSYADGGQVRRIAYVGEGNARPQAAIAAEPTAGTVPLTVNFSASGSRDPEGGTLTYRWNFGDGGAATGETVTHTYEAPGAYTATLTVRDPQGAQDAATVAIGAGNTPPAPRITAPSAGERFAVGDTITLRGEATDAEDGALTGSRLSWSAELHHNEHTHPYLARTSGSEVTLAMPAPEDLEATTGSFLEVTLTATDAGGLSRTVTQKLLPKLVEVGFETEPSGLKLALNGVSFAAPKTFSSWEGYALTVDAPTQTASGRTASFRAWSDGGPAQHTVVTPASAAIYTASFDLSEGQKVVSFSLINAVTDTPIAGYDPLPEGAVLDLSELPTRRLNIRANTSPAKVGSVRFRHNGSYRTDNRAPYAVRGDRGGNFYAWTPALGTHTVGATPYSRWRARGEAGTGFKVSFKVVR